MDIIQNFSFFYRREQFSRDIISFSSASSKIYGLVAWRRGQRRRRWPRLSRPALRAGQCNAELTTFDDEAFSCRFSDTLFSSRYTQERVATCFQNQDTISVSWTRFQSTALNAIFIRVWDSVHLCMVFLFLISSYSPYSWKGKGRGEAIKVQAKRKEKLYTFCGMKIANNFGEIVQLDFYCWPSERAIEKIPKKCEL